jgi:proline iminopeptidase
LPGNRSEDNIGAYQALLWHADPAVALAASRAWTGWEVMTSALVVPPERLTAAMEARSALAFARIENHYFRHGGWFEEGQLIAQVDRLRSIPAVIIQGRWDLCCPAQTAADLAQAWPEADFQLLQAGHSVFEPAIVQAMVAASDRFAA